MSKGALIFAFDSDYCYTKIAAFAARQVQKHLSIPVTLVTNVDVPYTCFDKIIKITDIEEQYRTFKDTNSQEVVKWLNTNRFDAYNLSPYDQTLVIDADYLVFSKSLEFLFDTDLEFACYGKAFDITNQNRLDSCKRVSPISIPMQWATVIYFTKNKFAKEIFTFMQLIKQNWKYYSFLYHFNGGVYRNDFSLSIALQALSGYSTKQYTAIPGSLFSVDTSAELISLDPTDGSLIYKTDNKVCKITNTDLHVMNKNDLSKLIP
jgi:hypothetical protein